MLSSNSMKPKKTYSTPTATVYRVAEIYQRSGCDASGNPPVFLKPDVKQKKVNTYRIFFFMYVFRFAANLRSQYAEKN